MIVQKVNNNDLKIIRFIVEYLIDNNQRKPTDSHLEKLLSDNRTYLFAAFLDNQIIGYALAYKFPSLHSSDYLAYLYDIEVVVTHRRKGAGRLLIETLLDALKMDDVKELWLGTATNNAEGQALFTSTGGVKSKETFNDFTYEL